MNTGIRFHSLKNIIGLISYTVQGGTGKVRIGYSPCHPENTASRILVPVGSAQACKCWNHVDPISLGYTCSQCFYFIGLPNEVQFITKPLNNSTSNKNATFQCIFNPVIYFPGHGG